MLTPPQTYRIGPWEFSPRDNELRRNGERRRLEDRAARTLELLCRHRGETVSSTAIIDEVWMGRQLSPNSVAVVISSLRAALDDDARTPRHIETVAKRGYRLIHENGDDRVETPARPSRQLLLLALGVVAVAVAVLLLAMPRGAPAGPSVAFAQVINDTGSPRYEPVARSVDGLIVDGLQRGGLRQLRVTPGQPPPGGALLLEARLILWTGTPTVNFTVVDPASEVIASGMAGGPPPRFPETVGRVMDELAARLRTRE